MSTGHKIHLIVGLGNPEPSYTPTRHNVGERALYALTPSHTLSFNKGFRGATTDLVVQNKKNILLFPHTYMNHSGEAVSLVSTYYHIPAQDIWVIQDDLDVPFGILKVQFDRGAAGHHGIESIIAHLGTTAFWRIRIGIKPSTPSSLPTEKFVLGKFTAEEEDHLPHILRDVASTINRGLTNGDLLTETINTTPHVT
jgi:PTH1 family peptidyl-tRNA hydrolase